jgi:DNA/RNA-binding domain of Phe-tRNA-synthetase-like protein
LSISGKEVPVRVTIHADLQGIVRAGVMRLDRLTWPADGGDALWEELSAAAREIHDRWRYLTVGEIPGVDEARRLYRAVGLDPTKTRPSSEALLRRVIKGKGLYRIHPLVDLLNLVSLSALIPVGLYDEAKLAGDLATIRIGGEGEGFDGIRKARVNVQGRLCVADRQGAFGSPTSDSLRTSIDGPVRRVLAIFFQYLAGESARLARALDQTAALAARHFGAVVHGKMVITD